MQRGNPVARRRWSTGRYHERSAKKIVENDSGSEGEVPERGGNPKFLLTSQVIDKVYR